MYVYWWHVRGLSAVKVGYAEDPRQHVSDYRREFGLGGKEVRGYKLDGSIDPEWVERQLCRMLETWGLDRIALESDDGEEEEFFSLDGSTFEDIHERLRNAARHVVLAEVSNRRKQQRRRELQAVPEAASPGYEREPEAHRRYEAPPPPHRHVSSPFPLHRAAQAGIFLITTLIAWGLVADFMGVTVDRISAGLSELTKASVAGVPPEGGSAVARGLKSEDGERDAGASFEASEPARQVLSPPQPEPSLPQQALAKSEPPPQQVVVSPEPPLQPIRTAVPPEMPPPQPAASRPATVQAQPTRDTAPARAQCSVSRPQPGFQVYLVTCPDSHVMIGRTVDSPTGWTVSESVNGAEAIDFFMKSRYAR